MNFVQEGSVFFYKNNSAILLEKLCKSNVNTWGCYSDCQSPHNTSNNTSTTSSTNMQHNTTVDEEGECCNVSKKRRSLRASTSSTSSPSNKEDESVKKTWRPLLFFIPLRLGLSETNSAYFSSLKVNTEWNMKS